MASITLALDGFRLDFYRCLTARADALFEPVDGLCSPVHVDSLAHVTLARRRGGRISTSMSGGIGNDTINVQDGSAGDTANGGLGTDTCTKDPGDTDNSC